MILFPTLRPEFAPPRAAGRGGAPRPLAAPTPIAPGSVAGPSADGAAATSVVAAAEHGPVGARHHAARAPRAAPARRPAIAGLTALCGVLLLLTLIPFVHSRFDAARATRSGRCGCRSPATSCRCSSGLLLFLLADQLGKRKQRGLAGRRRCCSRVGAVAHVLKGPHPIALRALRRHAGRAHRLPAIDFRAPSDPPSLFRLVRFVPLYLRRRAGVRRRRAAGRSATASRPGLTLRRRAARRSFRRPRRRSTGPYTFRRRSSRCTSRRRWSRSASSAWSCLRCCCSGRWRARRRAHRGRLGARHALVHTYGWDTLAYFALRDDKSFFFSRDGEAFLAYTYIGGYALVVRRPDRRARVGRRTCSTSSSTMCEERAWTPGAARRPRGQHAAVRRRAGFSAFYLGDEAIIDCRRFTLEGAARKSLRRRRPPRRAHLPLPDDRASRTPRPRWSTQLNAISARWRGKHPERGFTMSLSQDVVGDGAQPRVPAVRRARRARRPRRVPAPRARLRAVVRLHARPHAPRPGRAQRHDRVPHRLDRPRRCASAGVARLSMNFAMWGRLFADDVPFTRPPAGRPAGRRACSTRSSRSSRCTTSTRSSTPSGSPACSSTAAARTCRGSGLLYAGAEGFLAVPVIGDLLVPKTVGGVEFALRAALGTPARDRSAP